MGRWPRPAFDAPLADLLVADGPTMAALGVSGPSEAAGRPTAWALKDLSRTASHIAARHGHRREQCAPRTFIHHASRELGCADPVLVLNDWLLVRRGW
jgi:hypothetical protein